MTLTILDTTIDEEFRTSNQSPPNTENDTSPLSTSVAAALDVLFDPVDFFGSPTGFPQYAEKTNFVSSLNTVTDYFLTSDENGTPFPAEGVETTLKVGSETVFLFGTDDPNVVVGRIGGGDGDIVLFIALEETVENGIVTGADLWVGLYAPLVQDGNNLVDSADTLDLDGLLYLGSDFNTTTEVPFENFNGVPSGNNLFNVVFPSEGTADVQLLLTGSGPDAQTGDEELSTVNVSTTGIGAGSQHIELDSTLRIDTVTGMVQGNVDQAPEVNQAGNVDYTARVNIVAADFEITQLNPGATPERVDILVSAFYIDDSLQEQAYINDVINDDGTPVEIDVEDVIVLNGAGQDITASLNITKVGDAIKIEGLNDGTNADKTDGDQVFFRTDGVSFNRIVITNADGDDTTFDVGNIHVTAVQGGSDTEFEELGSHVIFEDDGPIITGTGLAAPSVQADDSTLGTDPTGDFSVVFGTKNYGADGQGSDSYALGVKSANVASGLVDTASGQNVLLSYDSVTNKVFGKTASSGLTVFEISVSATGVVTLDQQRAVRHTDNNDFNSSIGLSAADLITLTLTITDAEAANQNDSASQTVNIGDAFSFLDDGPVITPQAVGSATPNNLVVDNDLADPADSQDSSSYGLTPGNDGLKSFGIVGPADSTGDFTWQYFNVDGVNGVETNEIKGFYKGNALYTLELENDGSYVFKMIGTLPSSTLNLSTAEIKAGAPDTNAILVGAIENDNYVQISGGGGAINESNAFVGVKNGNLDSGESLTFKLYDQIDGSAAPDPTADTQLAFQGIVIGSKSAQTSVYHVVATPLGGGTPYETDIEVAKNTPLTVDPPGDGLFTSVTITKVSGPALKIGIGDIDILIPANDVALSYTVRETDGDDDFTDASFTVTIDGNNDGSIANPIVASSTLDDLSLLTQQII